MEKWGGEGGGRGRKRRKLRTYQYHNINNNSSVILKGEICRKLEGKGLEGERTWNVIALPERKPKKRRFKIFHYIRITHSSPLSRPSSSRIGMRWFRILIIKRLSHIYAHIDRRSVMGTTHATHTHIHTRSRNFYVDPTYMYIWWCWWWWWNGVENYLFFTNVHIKHKIDDFVFLHAALPHLTLDSSRLLHTSHSHLTYAAYDDAVIHVRVVCLCICTKIQQKKLCEKRKGKINMGK